MIKLTWYLYWMIVFIHKGRTVYGRKSIWQIASIHFHSVSCYIPVPYWFFAHRSISSHASYSVVVLCHFSLPRGLTASQPRFQRLRPPLKKSQAEIMDKLGTTRSVRTGYHKQVNELINAIVVDDLILASFFSVLIHVLAC